jgi:hypothetical protein
MNVQTRPGDRDATPVIVAAVACLAYAVLRLLAARAGGRRRRPRRRPWLWAGITAGGNVAVNRDPSSRRRFSLPTSIGASGTTSWLAAAGVGERPALEPVSPSGGPLPR